MGRCPSSFLWDLGQLASIWKLSSSKEIEGDGSILGLEFYRPSPSHLLATSLPVWGWDPGGESGIGQDKKEVDRTPRPPPSAAPCSHGLLH